MERYTLDNSVMSTMQLFSQEVTFAALRPLMQDIVVDSDLEVRME